jgi:hypothetical protein
MMPEEPTTPDLVELTRLSLAAFNRGDFAAYASPDIVLDTAGYGIGTFKDREAGIGMLKDWTSSVEDLTIEPDEILDLGHGVASPCTTKRAVPSVSRTMSEFVPPWSSRG